LIEPRRGGPGTAGCDVANSSLEVSATGPRAQAAQRGPHQRRGLYCSCNGSTHHNTPPAHLTGTIAQAKIPRHTTHELAPTSLSRVCIPYKARVTCVARVLHARTMQLPRAAAHTCHVTRHSQRSTRPRAKAAHALTSHVPSLSPTACGTLHLELWHELYIKPPSPPPTTLQRRPPGR
jgi:hypothetical protein